MEVLEGSSGLLVVGALVVFGKGFSGVMDGGGWLGSWQWLRALFCPYCCFAFLSPLFSFFVCFIALAPLFLFLSARALARF